MNLKTPSNTNNRTIGYESEKQVVQFLVFGGYSVVAVNWYFGHKEVDIIAEDDRFRIFIEVKSQNRNQKISLNKSRNGMKIGASDCRWAFPSPENKVNQKKKESMIECANAYNFRYPTAKQIRYDIISVLQFNFGSQIMHFKNAFSHSCLQKATRHPRKNGWKTKSKSKRWDVFYI